MTEDVFTEPTRDPRELANLGPLTHLLEPVPGSRVQNAVVRAHAEPARPLIALSWWSARSQGTTTPISVLLSRASCHAKCPIPIHRRRQRSRLDFRFRDDGIVISTRSKCGTTWMQMVCALLVFQTADLPAPLVELSPWVADDQVVLAHPDRGRQTVGDVVSSNAHDAYHHAWDIEQIERLSVEE